ncbi:MAG: hypothetical protein JW809_13960 [Pirellulales bacterium]|nr:hypothetical protein [Pirellulales bacterium]
MGQKTNFRRYARGLVGAAIGGLLGLFLRWWLLRFELGPVGLPGRYLDALVLPGALAGLGCGLLSGGRSWVLAVLCGLGGLGLGIVSEWKSFPFVANGSPIYFVIHLHRVRTVAKIMIVLGAAFGFWFGLGRDAPPGRDASEEKTLC